MRPINVSKLHQQETSPKSVQNKSRKQQEDDTDEEEDETEDEINRIRNPRLFKGEAYPLTDFQIIDQGDFQGAAPLKTTVTTAKEDEIDRIVQMEILSRYQNKVHTPTSQSEVAELFSARINRMHKHTNRRDQLRTALGSTTEYTEEERIPYQSAVSRHRRRQHMLVFEGFHDIKVNALSP